MHPLAESIEFTASDGVSIKGYFFPGATPAAVIVLPAFNNSRGSELHYAQILNSAGFSVVTLNSRVCSSPGRVSLGYDEVLDAQAAYAYLKTRSDVDAQRVGLFGFSSAGATAIMAAARMPDIRSVVAMGGYHNYADALGKSDQFLVNLYQQGVRWAYRLFTGHDISVLDPLSSIEKLPPRPLFLIYGSREVSLPGARIMLERALSLGIDAHLWVMEGADHGDYVVLDPEGFREQVVRFERAALLDEPAS